MITASQLRAARALLGIDQLTLAQRATLSLPTIQRMKTSDGLIRGNVDSLVKVIQALEDWRRAHWRGQHELWWGSRRTVTRASSSHDIAKTETRYGSTCE